MTTDVYITGIDPNIPEWSTEATLEKILNKLPRGGRVEMDLRAVVDTLKETRNADRKAHAAAAKNLNEVTNAVQKSTSANKQALTKVKKELQDTGRDDEPKQTLKGAAIGTVTSTVGAIGELTDNIFDLGSDFRNFRHGPFGRFSTSITNVIGKLGPLGMAAGAVSGAFAVLGTAVGRYIRLVMDSANVFREFNEVGLRGINTSAQLYDNLNVLAMSSSEFQKVMTDYSTAMNTFGMESLKNIISASGDATKHFNEFGMTTAEGTQFLARQLQQRRLSGIFTLRSEEEQRESLEKSIETVSAFSTMMGVSRQRIMENLTQILEQDRIRAVFASIRDDTQRERASEAFNTVIKMFTALGKPGEQFADFFADMTSVLDPVMAESFQQMVPFAGDAAMSLANLARASREGEMSSEDAVDRMFEFGDALERNSGTILYMAQMQDPMARQMAGLLSQFREMRSNFEDIARRERITVQEVARRRAKADSELAKSSARLQDQIVRVRTGFNRLLIEFFDVVIGTRDATNVIDRLASVGKSLGEVFQQMSNWLKGFFDEHSELSMFDRIGLLLSKGFEAIFQSIFDAMARSNNPIFKAAGFLLGGIAATDPIEREKEKLRVTGLGGFGRGFMDVVSPFGILNPMTPTLSNVRSDWEMHQKWDQLSRYIPEGIEPQRVGQIKREAIGLIHEGSTPQKAIVNAITTQTTNLEKELKQLREDVKKASDDEKEQHNEEIARLEPILLALQNVARNTGQIAADT